MDWRRKGLAGAGAVTAVVAAVWAVPAAAEEVLLHVGDKVRVRVERDERVGIVQALDERTLALREPSSGRVAVLDLNSVRTVEVSRGPGSRGRNAGRGARVGALVGAAAGVFVGSCVNSDDECGGFLIPVAAAVLGAGGAGVGALVGASVPPGEVWTRARVPRVTAAVVPMRRGVRLEVKASF